MARGNVGSDGEPCGAAREIDSDGGKRLSSVLFHRRNGGPAARPHIAFRCSAAVAQVAVNHLVAGSNPATGANFRKGYFRTPVVDT